MTTGDAWEELEAALTDVTPYPHKVSIYPSVPFIVPYRVRAVIEYRPDGHIRNRNDAVQGEGLTVAEAMADLTAKLREYAESGRYSHAAVMAKFMEENPV